MESVKKADAKWEIGSGRQTDPIAANSSVDVTMWLTIEWTAVYDSIYQDGIGDEKINSEKLQELLKWKIKTYT